MLRTRLVPSIVVLALAACGTPSGSADAGTDPPYDTVAFEARANAAICKLAVRCGHVGLDEPTCLRALPTLMAEGDDFGLPSAIAASIKAGAITVDRARVSSCLDELGSVGCYEALDALWTIAACRGAFTGTVAIGGRCIANEACADGWCEQGVGATCSGTCLAYVTTGCRSDAACGPDRTCVNASSLTQGHCEDGTRGGPGEACGPGDSCRGDLECVKGEGTATCRELPVGNEQCSLRGACASGFYCKGGETAANGVCVKVAGVGGACETSDQCGGAMSPLYCDTETKKCVDRPVSGPCLPEDTYGGCDYTKAWCDTFEEPPTCKPLVAPGAACSGAAQCGAPFLGTCASAGGTTVCGPAIPTACVP